MIKEVKGTAYGQGWLKALVRSREASLVLLIAVLTVQDMDAKLRGQP